MKRTNDDGWVWLDNFVSGPVNFSVDYDYDMVFLVVCGFTGDGLHDTHEISSEQTGIIFEINTSLFHALLLAFPSPMGKKNANNPLLASAEQLLLPIVGRSLPIGRGKYEGVLHDRLR